MRFNVSIRNMGPQAEVSTILDCVQAAESSGVFEGAFVVDHLCVPPEASEGSDGRTFEALTTLAFLAGATSRIRIGVSVLIAPYRPSFFVAKQVATIQELCGGRLILGVGVGYIDGEFRALGVSRKRRGALTDELLETIYRVFEQDVSESNGQPFVFSPRPARPLIWVGGRGVRTIERAARYGDAYHPINLTDDELRERSARVRELAAEYGRPSPGLAVYAGFDGEVPPLIDRLGVLGEIGVDDVVIYFHRYANGGAFRERVSQFTEEVAPHFR